MNHAEKKEIAALLEAHVARFPSQKSACDRLTKISEATVIGIRKGAWDGISDAMWASLGKQVGYSTTGSWKMSTTRAYKALAYYYQDAQEHAGTYGIIGKAGTGKSASAKDWVARHPNVYHVTCAEFWNRKMFLSKVLEAMGKETGGMQIGEMMDAIVTHTLRQESPLLIIDEADKLSDQVLYFFITLYNALQGKCGLILMATEFLEKRILRGHRMNKKGYAEILSRLGRKFIELPAVSRTEVKDICELNGEADAMEIATIYNDADGDLRRVQRLVHRNRLKKSHSQAA